MGNVRQGVEATQHARRRRLRSRACLLWGVGVNRGTGCARSGSVVMERLMETRSKPQGRKNEDEANQTTRKENTPGS